MTGRRAGRECAARPVAGWSGWSGRSGTSRQPRVQDWLALPVQSQIWTWVPGVVDQPVSSRHLPDCGL